MQDDLLKMAESKSPTPAKLNISENSPMADNYSQLNIDTS